MAEESIGLSDGGREVVGMRRSYGTGSECVFKKDIERDIA